MESDFRVSLFQLMLTPHPDWLNRVVDLLLAGVFEFKAFTLFSFLFGVGVQTERTAARRHSSFRFRAGRYPAQLSGGEQQRVAGAHW